MASTEGNVIPFPIPGFTPFAKDHLVSVTDDGKHVTPTTDQTFVFVMGGRNVQQERIRREVRLSFQAAWFDYNGRWGMTLLWVKWSDGRRHLVHRKGS